MSAALIGSGVGLSLGAAYLASGMAGHAADHVRAQRITQAAASGYVVSHLEAQGPGLRAGLERYGYPGAAQMRPTLLPTLTGDKGVRKARRRADLECLADAVYYEARGESPRGQAAVAQVVMNRVKHPAFPKSVCAVVFQGAGRRGCQFSFACDGSMRRAREAAAWSRARRVATRALAGAALADIGSATHFHTTGVAPAWGPQMLRVASVGAHVFYRFAPHRLRRQIAPPDEAAALIAEAGDDVQQPRLDPALAEQGLEAKLQPAATEPADSTAAPVPTPIGPLKPAEAAAFSPSQPISAAAS